MKNSIKYTLYGFAAFVMVSCTSQLENTKDIKYMPIRFKPLARNEFTLVGNLQAESQVISKQTKHGLVLTGTFAENVKTGLVSNQGSTTEILYFAPGAGEAITGSLYEGAEIQEVSASKSSIRAAVIDQAKKNEQMAAHNGGLLGWLFFKLRQKARKATVTEDHALNYAYFALVDKYPDIDYFINVRFDRKTTQKGNLITELVVVKADGIKLKTD